MNIVLTDIVRLKEPLCQEEKDLLFEVTNINEVTNRCYITCINSNLSIMPTELVSMNDIMFVRHKTIVDNKNFNIRLK